MTPPTATEAQPTYSQVPLVEREGYDILDASEGRDFQRQENGTYLDPKNEIVYQKLINGMLMPIADLKEDTALVNLDDLQSVTDGSGLEKTATSEDREAA